MAYSSNFCRKINALKRNALKISGDDVKVVQGTKYSYLSMNELTLLIKGEGRVERLKKKAIKMMMMRIGEKKIKKLN